MRSIILFLFIAFCNNAFSQSSPRTILFSPENFYREYSVKNPVALTISAGDTIYTESVDAGGFDKNGTQVTERGNPLTGPFFISNAEPGDILAIKILSVSLNRNYATTLNALIPKMDEKKAGMKNWRGAKLVRWILDTVKMTGKPDPRYDKLKDLTIPLHPFIGCVGVASVHEKGMSSGGTDYSGGNMDFRFVTAGATVYLPVNHPGAILYLGDGHAAQGDGELNGDALETSMRFSFTTKLIKDKRLPVPMIEDSLYYMILGVESTLEKSMKVATMKMAGWLKEILMLNTEEVSQLIGPV
ncbi:MAG: acetamidase/formamidase family protein, partial [Chitinophagaceae bacterium]|nr:acetamidase/formamidase family protein [Chitinophagaceae bacterium]